jgi:DNA-binding response OmpR family regulator
MKIHLIDKDRNIFAQLTPYFNLYDLSVSSNLKDAFHHLHQNHVDILILEFIWPGMGSFQNFRSLRKVYPKLPVIIISDIADDFNKIAALELGAEDFIVRPFNSELLLARIKSITRIDRIKNVYPAENKIVICSEQWDLKINLENRNVTYQGKNISLTFTEFEILKNLLLNTGIIMTREALISKFHGLKDDASGRLIDTYIKRIRKKLENGSQIIKTIRGIGYVIKNPQ